MGAALNPADVDGYLRALFSRSASDAYVEIRFRTDTGMGRAFYGTAHLSGAATMIARLAPTTDVFVGVLPRRRQASDRNALVSHAAVLWADCDTPLSVDALRDFVPEPSVLVASGSRGNCHAYWLLRAHVATDMIERANRCIAALLCSDLTCADSTRILRPPSLNHKHTPPTTVRLIRCDSEQRYAIDEIVRLPAHDNAAPRERIDHRIAHQKRDPLLRIEPTRYVEQLSGERVRRDHKIACPFHPDDTPSLHVYADPARGWCCFGCRRGGSIYDFAGLIFEITPRGAGFSELQRRLLEMFVVPSERGKR